MNVNDIIEAFFNLEGPCPPQIIECDQIRSKYKEEVDKMTKEGCSQCKKNGIKARYLEQVWKQAIEALTKNTQ